ncbi:MAG: hypothetical protein OWT28_02845 [Firmicutes bacterium]|nr:hypothetical protein [Bacillota bacterium]
MNTPHEMCPQGRDSVRTRIVILSAGVAQIVDEGRLGYGQQGIPEAMPFDLFSARLAWSLLPSVRQVRPWWIEVGLTPSFSFTADKPLWVSVAGGARTIMIGSHQVAKGEPVQAARFYLTAGTPLLLGPARTGTCSYVAVAGAWAGGSVLGSVSTIVGVGLSGLAGRRLVPHDEIFVQSVATAAGARVRHIRYALRGTWSDFSQDVRVQPLLRYSKGPEHEAIVRAQGLSERSQMVAEVTSQLDRQGIRLRTQSGFQKAWPELPASSPTAHGLIQWPAGGDPIILGPDRQTVGGYPRLGTIIAADRMRLGSLRPGQTIHLVCVERTTAVRAYEALLAQMRNFISMFYASGEAEGQHGT